MFRLNGIGTTIYGKRDVDPADGSYIVTKWFTLLYLPIIPLGSYRVIKEKKHFLAGHPTYQMREAPTNVKQIVLTYAAWWAIPFVFLVVVLIGVVVKPG